MFVLFCFLEVLCTFWGRIATQLAKTNKNKIADPVAPSSLSAGDLRTSGLGLWFSRVLLLGIIELLFFSQVFFWGVKLFVSFTCSPFKHQIGRDSQLVCPYSIEVLIEVFLKPNLEINL